MKQNFLIDENLVVSDGEYEGIAIEIWLAIGRNCHRIGIDHELNSNYQRKINRATGGRSASVAGSVLPTIVYEVLANSEKAIWVGPVDPGDLIELIRDHDDRYLVKIALGLAREYPPSPCLLVTTDPTTREDFCLPRMRDAGIGGVQPEEGIDLARQPGSG